MSDPSDCDNDDTDAHHWRYCPLFPPGSVPVSDHLLPAGDRLVLALRPGATPSLPGEVP